MINGLKSEGCNLVMNCGTGYDTGYFDVSCRNYPNERDELRALLDHASRIDAVDVGPWLPSVLVRRREYLELVVE